MKHLFLNYTRSFFIAYVLAMTPSSLLFAMEGFKQAEEESFAEEKKIMLLRAIRQLNTQISHLETKLAQGLTVDEKELRELRDEKAEKEAQLKREILEDFPADSRFGPPVPLVMQQVYVPVYPLYPAYPTYILPYPSMYPLQQQVLYEQDSSSTEVPSTVPELEPEAQMSSAVEETPNQQAQSDTQQTDQIIQQLIAIAERPTQAEQPAPSATATTTSTTETSQKAEEPQTTVGQSLIPTTPSTQPAPSATATTTTTTTTETSPKTEEPQSVPTKETRSKINQQLTAAQKTGKLKILKRSEQEKPTPPITPRFRKQQPAHPSVTVESTIPPRPIHEPQITEKPAHVTTTQTKPPQPAPSASTQQQNHQQKVAPEMVDFWGSCPMDKTAQKPQQKTKPQQPEQKTKPQKPEPQKKPKTVQKTYATVLAPQETPRPDATDFPSLSRTTKQKAPQQQQQRVIAHAPQPTSSTSSPGSMQSVVQQQEAPRTRWLTGIAFLKQKETLLEGIHLLEQIIPLNIQPKDYSKIIREDEITNIIQTLPTQNPEVLAFIVRICIIFKCSNKKEKIDELLKIVDNKRLSASSHLIKGYILYHEISTPESQEEAIALLVSILKDKNTPNHICEEARLLLQTIGITVVGL